MFIETANKFLNLFSSIYSTNGFSNDEIELICRDIRNILIESDVPLEYIKDFICELKKKIPNKDIKKKDKKIFIAKLLYRYISNILGNIEREYIPIENKINIIALFGSNGVGKTSTIVKIANFLKQKYPEKKILCVSFDIIRLAAQEQLESLCKTHHIECLKMPFDNNIKNLKILHDMLKINYFDIVLVDMPGINHKNNNSVNSLENIIKSLHIKEKWLVVDSTFGSNSTDMIKSFIDNLHVNSIIVSKVDANSKGGIFFTIKYITNIPVIYITYGENIMNISKFDSKSITNRILGNGDIKELWTVINNDGIRKKTFDDKTFNFNILLSHLKTIKKFGSFKILTSFLPGFNKTISKLDQKATDFLKKQISILESMTSLERMNVKLLNEESRIKRIAFGSGNSINDTRHIIDKLKEILNSLSLK